MKSTPDVKRQRMYWAGLAAILAALLLLLSLQYLWMERVQEVSAIAQRVALRNYLEAVGKQVEFHYRSRAERLLNLPAEIFTEAAFKKAVKRWSLQTTEGIRRLFLVDFTREEFGNFLVFHPESRSLETPLASEESMAIIVACAPWQLRSRQGSAAGAGALRVEEIDPAHRIVMNPIADDVGQMVGIAGMILDEDYFRDELLPVLVQKALAGFFPEYSQDDLAVIVRNGRGELALGRAAPDAPGEPFSAGFPFVFTDWTLGLQPLGSAPEEWARTSTAFNMLLSVLLAAMLMGGIVLALRAAGRSMRLSEMKSDFVSNVSHELRTPLASIRVFAEFLRTGRTRSKDQVREYGEYIEAESRRLSRLIENILDFSKIESGQKTYRFAPADLAAIVTGTLETFRRRASAREFAVDYEGPGRPLPPVTLDAGAIGQALDNLLDNALKYSGDSRRIEVRLRAGDREVRIAVTDRGIGIPREEQRHIFDRFHRAGRGPVHDVKGSGLGLAIVHHVVQAHGGSVSVESEPGRGSTFTIHLPATGPDAGPGK